MTPERTAVLQWIAEKVAALGERPIVAVDGVDGAGKTVFADELAPVIETTGRPVMRGGIDGFHNPRAVRYARGRASPQGYILDAYDYASLKHYLLDPFRAGADIVETARFNYRVDQVVTDAQRAVAPGSILLIDGIFLHRDELAGSWDFSIFLEVPFAVSFARMGARDGTPQDIAAVENGRYLEGQRLYFQSYRPQERSTLVIDKPNFDQPVIAIDRSR